MRSATRSIVFAPILAVTAFFLGPAIASAHEHDMDMSVPLGQVHFENSCSPDVKTAIDRGVSLLYSFWYDEARKSFNEVTAQEADCAMGYWGEAMSYYQPVEQLPSGEQLKAGQEAIARAQVASRKTARERGYIDALAVIYDNKAVPAHDARAQRYSDVMRTLSAAYPADHEAAVLYALSLLSPELPDDPDLIRSRKALTILNAVLKVEPDNPGVMHYIIHASDNPQMASLGLDAARRYAQIAPASAHALHMPGHIFARLGLWDEDIRSNLASKTAAESHSSMHIGAQNRLHAMEFLQYAYLQVGQDDQAKAIAVEASEIQPTELDPGFEDYYPWVEANFPSRLALETRDWGGALALNAVADAAPNAQRVTYWAHAVAAGHLRNRRAAEEAAEKYRATLTPSQLESDKTKPSALFAETRAWALFASGDVDGAVALLRPVADHQDKVGKGEVELPAREMMGDMLRLGGHPAAALREYRTSLRTDPGRFNTLLHAGEVAEELGSRQEATEYYRLLLKNAANPSVGSRRVLGGARSFLWGVPGRRHPC